MSKRPRAKRTLTRWRRLRRWLVIGLATILVCTVVPVAALRWLDPPTSSFMLQRWVAGLFDPALQVHIHHEWTDWDRIPDAVKLAVLAAEDQRFPSHRGFDRIEIERAIARHRAGGRLRGASTISQQTAKNLFLWSGRDPVRKGLEVWFTLLIETFWSKQRILEIYLNIAQFGPETYGVGAASWRYFHRPPATLTAADAALMAAVLPNPQIYRLEAPSATVRRRAEHIRLQMRRLGGVAYLQRL
ncbi:monofunctional biosynthetic peptidoglycan transglycosylase [Thiocapsa imhoffii]|uniref:Biosynthetic peptidoglycan transglycosylase n=1 Tax=Thiocapsa imhoffii TaxID=382777 RepID=A0A9X0WII3_9GAMM|nr:monofunctional biosynthetic peptidoglycan transglycosylase [Thiocapsa imhoffii]MBK1645391.1 monofunctional biosynthetic peptidoglycan transglycosylase [Thiocapsa imhoffii]